MEEAVQRKASLLADVVSNERNGHARKCAMLFAGIWAGVAGTLLLAVPLALALFDLVELKGHTLSILGVFAAPALTGTGWLFVSWMSALDCVQRLDSSLIAARADDLEFASELFRQAPCVGQAKKVTVGGVIKQLAGV